MKEFLEQNEGLASRIAFHLNFPDYSPEELTQILDLMLENRNTGWTKEQGKNAFPSAPMHAGKKITAMDGLSETCWTTLSCARQTASFGNIRMVRWKRGGLSSDGGRFRDDRPEKKPQSRQIGFCAG